MDKDLQPVTDKEIAEVDNLVQSIIAYTEDDRQKSNILLEYYQTLIDKGDNKGETRQSLAKSLELREASVNNLIEILKLKTKLIEKKIMLQMRTMGNSNEGYGNEKFAGSNTVNLIKKFEESQSETQRSTS